MILTVCLASIVMDHLPAYHLSEPTWEWLRSVAAGLGRYVNDFTTGPAMAGIFAIVAARIAYRGIKQQVEKAAQANENVAAANTETARKNTEEQWWSTLKWAYSEAKDFKPAQVDETRAVVAVLRSLAQQPNLSELQSNTVGRVVSMFEKSGDVDVQDQVDAALQDLDRSSDEVRAEALATAAAAAVAYRTAAYEDRLPSHSSPWVYKLAVQEALKEAAPKSSVLLVAPPVLGLDGRTREADALFITPNRLSVAIEVRFTKALLSRTAVTQLYSIMAAGTDASEPKAAAPGYQRALLISNQRLTASAQRFLEERRDVLGQVTWNPGDSLDPIKAELSRLMHS